MVRRKRKDLGRTALEKLGKLELKRVRSSPSNGMAESYVKTKKNNHVAQTEARSNLVWR